MTMASEPGKKHRWPYGQEHTQRCNPRNGSNGKISTANEVVAKAIFDQQIKNDQIKQACNQAG